MTKAAVAIGACVAISGFAWGCVGAVKIGGSGGGVLQVGPVMIKAQQSGKKLPQYIRDRELHVVGQASKSLQIQVKNKTRDYWRVALVRKYPKTKKFIWELRPYQRRELRRRTPGTRLLPMPDIAANPKKQARLRRATMLLYRENHSFRPIGRIILPVRREYQKQPAHKINIVYGDCSGYVANQIYNRWCLPTTKF